jgi:hypothetical protein
MKRAGVIGWLRGGVAAGVAASVVAALPASAAAPSFEAELACRPEAAPGRVLCELTCRATGAARLTWADALVTEAPSFVRPLRSRVAPERFDGSNTGERKLKLALVANGPGVGELKVKARAVLCEGAGASERCRPQTRDVSAEVRVGG